MGFIPVIGGFDISAGQPVDARMVFTSSIALFDSSSNGPFPATRRYYGMMVYITDQSMSYTLRSGEDRSGGGVNLAEWISGSVYAHSSSYATTASYFEYIYYNVTQSFSQFAISSSWSSQSLSASHLIYDGTFNGSASYALSSSWSPGAESADSASWASSSLSSSWANTSSIAQNSLVSDFALLAGEAINATNASSSLTSDFALLAGDSLTSTSSSYSLTSSYAHQSLTTNTSINAINVGINTTPNDQFYNIIFVTESSGYAPVRIDDGFNFLYNPGKNLLTVPFISSSLEGTSSWSNNSILSVNSDFATTTLSSSFASSSISSSYSSTASYFGSGSNNYFPQWNSNKLTAKSFLYGDSSHIGIGTDDFLTLPAGSLIINEGAIRHLVLKNPEPGGIPWSLVSTDSSNLSSGSRFVILAGNDQTDTPALLIWSSSAFLKRIGINKTHPFVELDVSGSVSASYYYSQFDDVGFIGTSSWAMNSLTSSYTLTSSYISGNFWSQGGNEWGNLGVIGTLDQQEISFIIDNNELVRFTTGSAVGILTRPTDFTLQIAGAIGPSLDNTFDLGSPSLRWKNVYAANLVASGSVTNATFAETSSISINSISSSYALTASFALNGGGISNPLTTGSTYPITSSWAVNWNSSSLISLINTKQNTLGTGSTYPFTSSWAINVVNDRMVSTGSSYPITSSWAVNWNSSSLVSLVNTKQNIIGTGSLLPITASWSINAITASDLVSKGNLIAGTNVTLDGIITNRLVGSGNVTINASSGGTGLSTGSLYPITSSWSVNATNWNSSSLVSLINTKQNIIGTGSLLPVTSSWSLNWNSSSLVSLINTKQNTLGTGSTYPFTSSWANSSVNSTSSSYSGNCLTASYISGSILFSGKSDYHYPHWINNILSSTGSLIQRPNYMLITGSGLSINNGTNPILPFSSSVKLDVNGSVHIGEYFPVSIWKSGSFPIIYFNAVPSGGVVLSGRGSNNHFASNILFDTTSSILSFNISPNLNTTEGQVVPFFDSKLRVAPSYIDSISHLPIASLQYDIGSPSYTWKSLYVNEISSSNITSSNIYLIDGKGKLFGSSSYSDTSSFALNVGGSITSTSSSWASSSLFSSTSSLLHSTIGSIGFISGSASITSTSSISFIPTSSFYGCVVNYAISNGPNRRVGQIFSVWSGSIINHNETSTTDIGTTSQLTLNMSLIGANAVLRAENLSSTIYQIKGTITYL